MKTYEVDFEIRIGDSFEDSGKALVCLTNGTVSEALAKELDLMGRELLVIKSCIEIRVNRVVLIKD